MSDAVVQMPIPGRFSGDPADGLRQRVLLEEHMQCVPSEISTQTPPNAMIATTRVIYINLLILKKTGRVKLQTSPVLACKSQGFEYSKLPISVLP